MGREMTLPTSGSISSDQIMAELRVANPTRAFPLSLTDADVLALAGKSVPPISIPADLYGKSSYTPMSGSVPDVSSTAQSDPPSNTVAHIPINVVFTGGQAPFTYAWSHVSGTGTVTAANANNTTANFTVAKFSTPGDEQTQVVQCVVTDSTGATMTRTGTATLALT
jgi:hypothetical protein